MAGTLKLQIVTPEAAVRRKTDGPDARPVMQREEHVVEESILHRRGDEDALPAVLPRGVGKLVQREDALDAGRDLDLGRP